MVHGSNDTFKASQARQWTMFALALMLLGTMLAPLNVRAGSIFDDDWAPPTPAGTTDSPRNPRPTEPTKPAQPAAPADQATPTDPSPATPPATPPLTPPSPPPGVASPARKPVPASADQAKSRKIFKEVFAADLANRAAVARRALAKKLLEQAAIIGNAPGDQFVLLVGAAEAAKEAADLELCCRAADALADSYDVDRLHFKSDAALTMTLRGDSAGATEENCRAGLLLADQLVAAEDYPAATRLLTALQAVASRAALASQIQARLKDVDGLRVATDRLAPQLQKLKTTPNDPAANLAVGEYLCFIKGDWAHGLPLLAKGAKSPTSAAAALDLADANTPGAQADIGDAWWTIAESDSGARQLAKRQRAVMWYSKALNDGMISGLRRTLLEMRVAATPQPAIVAQQAVTPPPPAPAPQPSKVKTMKVASARWGGGKKWVDVTEKVNEMLASGKRIWATSGTFRSDPTPGWRKRLEIIYEKDGVRKTLHVEEEHSVHVEEFDK